MIELKKMRDQEIEELLKDYKEFLADKDIDELGLRGSSTSRNDRWKGEPIFPHFKVGKNVRYWKKDIVKFLKQNRSPASK
jgi:hypothetical protein